MRFSTLSALVAASISLAGCFVAPLRTRMPLEVEVVDAETGTPIAGADVVYLCCDIHDRDCSGAVLVRAQSSSSGLVRIKGDRDWGPWIAAPGGLPVPNHFIAIWAPGFAAFVFSQYGDATESRRNRISRSDLLDALAAIPSDQSSSDPSLNPRQELQGGTIRLRRSQQ